MLIGRDSHLIQKGWKEALLLAVLSAVTSLECRAGTVETAELAKAKASILAKRQALPICEHTADLIRHKRYVEAERESSRALAMAPNFKAPLLLHGVAVRFLKKLDQSKQDLRKSLLVDSKYVPAWLELSRTQTMLHNANSGQSKPQNTWEFIEAGWESVMRRDGFVAIGAFQRALQRDPSNVDAMFGLAFAQYCSQKYSSAEKTIRSALAIDPQNAQAMALLARVLRSDPHRRDEEKEVLEHLTKMEPNLVDGWNLLADINDREHPQEALTMARRALALDPSNPWALHDLGVCQSNAKQKTLAMATCKEILALEPGFSSMRLLLAQLYSETGHMKDAESCLREGNKLEPTRPPYWFEIGVLYERQGRNAEAQDAFARAVKIDPKNQSAWTLLGVEVMNKGDQTQALKCFQTAVKLDPTDGQAWSNLGATIGLDGDKAEAEKCLRKAVALEPNNAMAQSNMSEILFEKNDFKGALQAADAAIKGNPTEPRPWVRKAFALSALGKKQESEAAWQKSMALGPKNTHVWSSRGDFLDKQKDFKGATAAVQKAIELTPKDDELYFMKAGILKHAGDLKAAEEAMDRATQLNPARMDYWRMLSAMRLVRGDKKGAEAALCTALKCKTVDRDELYRVAADLDKLGNNAQARMAYSSGLKAAPEETELILNMPDGAGAPTGRGY